MTRLVPPCCFAWTLAACSAPAATTDDAPTTVETTGTTGISGSTTGDAATSASDGVPTTSGAPDGRLRLHQLQALGTHNSYHLSPGTLVKEWDYTHLPLDQQLEEQGVRKFELDLWFGGAGEPIAVHHIDLLDTSSTCATLVDCLMVLKTWSDGHLMHHPLYVMLEIKSAFDPPGAQELLATLESQVLSVWPADRLVLPDDVQGSAANLRDGVAAGGWPAIDDARGKLLLVLHDGGKWREAYTDGGTSTAGRLLFPDAFGDLTLPFAAVHSLNDPVGDAARIEAAVAAGHLVRTRADADNVEPSAGDTSRGEAALASGAHFISTDYPPPKGDKYDYVFAIPGGTPSRCNPVTAPPDCTPAAIEAL
ncbi:Phosphoinositide phospholipase C, Ca2+-dependent [Nannocystis exedens]|uniref:Phosphoinositide phospholipase C, Ca2+-dependent n=1 Tax=Nannocystis exedens TaxID=54 RepID=A0A1I1TI54_9BACT|nr:Ca2+-dependent phosphoinositide-specific phospholipase C [Nannocystis exedens]PCC66657.1 acid phosphatase [Nannocystis exedens]SFD56083.1 Phosphoinositide phospholipase C, Ca2+-dependent [Nannocystis exedens]